jgi:hypothetical protein
MREGPSAGPALERVASRISCVRPSALRPHTPRCRSTGRPALCGRRGGTVCGTRPWHTWGPWQRGGLRSRHCLIAGARSAGLATAREPTAEWRCDYITVRAAEIRVGRTDRVRVTNRTFQAAERRGCQRFMFRSVTLAPRFYSRTA